MLPAPEPTAPDQFGPYELFERLGVGGMATVYRAKKRGPAGFERSVALKRMLPHLSEEASFVESFIREAKVASVLQHPNIAQVYDFGRIGGVYYIAMELVPGFDVRKLLRYSNRANESIPLAVVLTILGELCDALEYAHQFVDETGTPLHIVHRDISPSNLIVAQTGHLKVIDFGIAKASSRTLHTESGMVKGKLGYMSPEVALGMPVAPVSDVFSTGVVAWELVTSSPLFSSRTDFETMRRIREGEVTAPSGRNPACPPELDRLIIHALERDPAKRLSAASFRRGLDAIATRLQLQVGPRACAEWIRQFAQPEDYARFSGGPLPQDAATSVLRPSARARLKRSQDEIALATELWGEDVAPTSASDGPDFSVELGQPPPSISTPMPTQMPPMFDPALASFSAPAPVAPRASRTGIMLLGVLAIIAGILAAILIFRSPSTPTTPVAQLEPTPAGSAAPEPIAATTPPAVAPQPPAPAPVPTAKPTPAIVPKPKTKSTKHVVTHTEHVVEQPEPRPDPTPAPPPVVETPVTPPVVPPPTPKPDPKPTRTPVVAAAAVTKLAGEVPTIRGENDGDVLVKMCIDEAGKVTSVKVVKATTEMPPDLTHALEGWRYKPYLNKDSKPTAVCFALSLRVVVKRAN